MKRSFHIVFIILVLLLTASCSKNDLPLDEVSLQLKWVHQAQFAGYYTAVEKGFYLDEGIDLTLVEGGIGIDPLDELARGNVDFAIAAPELVIMDRAEGSSIKAVAVMFQTNPFLLISLADSGIDVLEDFPGHKIAVANIEGRNQYYLMMENAGLDYTTVEEIDFTFNYAPFYAGEVDIMPAFAAGSFLDIVQKGIEVNQFWPDDYGVHWYSDSIVVSDAMITEYPDLVERFLRATIKGMEYMITNQDEAVAITMQYAVVQDESIQHAMLEASIPLVYTGVLPIGWMEEAKWLGMIEDLNDQGLVNTAMPVNRIYTMQFLNTIYGELQ